MRARYLLIAALVLTAAGCEPAPEDALFGPQTIDAGGDADAGGDGGQSIPTDDMTGTWALAGDWSTCVTIFDNTELRSRYIHRVEIVQDGHRLQETHRVCRVENTPLLDLETVVPRAVTDAASPLSVESEVIGPASYRSYRSEAQVQLWGIQMEEPFTEPFPGPDDLPDDRIYDSDGDGEPGATLRLGGDFCNVQVVQRSFSAISGLQQPDGSFEGSGYMFTEQTILDASNDFCNTSYETVSNDDYSFFRLVRVDEDGLDLDHDDDGEISCDEILQSREQIIQWRVPDDSRCEPE